MWVCVLMQKDGKKNSITDIFADCPPHVKVALAILCIFKSMRSLNT